MPHQHYIDSQLAHHRRQLLTALDDVPVIDMRCRRVYRVVEHDRLPSHIRILRDRALHELLMLCRRTVVGVDHHEQRIVIHEPVVRACCRRAQLRAFIRQIEVFIVCRAAAVMVTDRRRARQIRQRVIQVACILRLIVVRIDLITCGYQEIRIELRDRCVQRLIPSDRIGLSVAGADLRVTCEDEAVAIIEIAGLERIDLADRIAVDHTVHIRRIFFQAGHGRLIAVEALIIGGDGCRCRFAVLCREQTILHIGPLGPLYASCFLDIRIPGQVTARLI